MELKGQGQGLMRARQRQRDREMGDLHHLDLVSPLWLQQDEESQLQVTDAILHC